MDGEAPITWHDQLASYCGDELAAKLCPPGRAVDEWAPVDQDVVLAWAIYTELRTRIATQSLPLRDGLEAAALKSLVDLFGISRRALIERPLALHSAALVTHCLNAYVRPFTARWHPKSESGAMASLDQRFTFRSELHRVQVVVRGLARVLGGICGDKDALEFLKALPRESPNPATRRGRLPYGIGTVNRPAVVGEMNVAEGKLLQLRRGTGPTNIADPVYDAVGLAMSGGGIRSATFCLGVVQVLARRGILKDVDVMSTVSGGGYLGTFITSALNSDDPAVGLGVGKEPFTDANGTESACIRYLRNHSKYLSEGGLTTLALMVFSAAYGIAMSLLLVAPFLAVLALAAVYMFGAGPEASVGMIAVDPLLLSEIVWLLLAMFVVALSIMRKPSGTVHRNFQYAAVLLLFGGLAIWFAQGINGIFGITDHPLIMLGAVLLLPIALAVAGLWWGATIPGRIAWSLLAMAGPLIFLALWLLGVKLVVWLRGTNELLPWIVLVVLFAHAAIGVNINFASLHLYYRDRLARTYMRRVSSTEAVDPQPLSGLNPQNKAPLHLINAAVNLPASKNPDLRGRNTDFFTFAKHYCGGPTVGWWSTAEWEAKDGHLDLGTAMAISGAAAAPRMGTLTSAKYTTLLAMLNVRLGYWLRRPESTGPLNGVPGASYFLRELTGLIHESLPFVNLSDGGHIENIGLYELLRRRCRFIVAIDGEADPNQTFGGLLTAIQMANIDLGVRIDPDLTDLRHGIEHFKRAHFVMTRIDYGVSDAAGEPVLGLLLVIKLALTGNESELLMRYRRENPAFPHQSTAEQLFSESQFEAYRALGEHAAEAAFDPLLVQSATDRTSDWLRALEQRLLPIP